MPDFKVEQETVSFWLKVKPRSARERLAFDSTGELRLELHAPPTEGEAKAGAQVKRNANHTDAAGRRQLRALVL